MGSDFFKLKLTTLQSILSLAARSLVDGGGGGGVEPSIYCLYNVNLISSTHSPKKG